MHYEGIIGALARDPLWDRRSVQRRDMGGQGDSDEEGAWYKMNPDNSSVPSTVVMTLNRLQTYKGGVDEMCKSRGNVLRTALCDTCLRLSPCNKY